uniref:Uncharacterized protein n=1 Tax=Daucus carota subsp. sativus TaxID=79200 RepID=A0A162A482_DAUCS
MAGTGGFAVSRSHGGDRFYNPPAMRRHQQLLLQQQLQRPEKSPAAAAAVAAVPEAAEAQKRSESDGSVSALSKKASDCGSSEAKKVTNESNIDRLMEAVTPNVAAKYCPEVNGRGWRSREAGLRPFYNLGDLWESLKEWSVYGAGVPMIIKETDSVVQYYVPYLSGLQLYADPSKRPANNSEYEADRRKHVADGSHQNAVNLSSQKMKSLSLRDKYPVNSSGEEGGNSNSPGLLVFEYLEYEQPYSRKPLTDKANGGQSQSHGSSCVGKVINASAGSSKISLPVIGLASYKYKGSILSPSAPQDYEHENSLLEAANSWLQGLNVALPDLQFFRSHYSRR